MLDVIEECLHYLGKTVGQDAAKLPAFPYGSQASRLKTHLVKPSQTLTSNSTHLSADAVSSSSPLWLQLTQLTGAPWPTNVVPAPACFASGSHRQRAVLSLAAVSSRQPSPELKCTASHTPCRSYTFRSLDARAAVHAACLLQPQAASGLVSCSSEQPTNIT
jgi:hypothetical protein